MIEKKEYPGEFSDKAMNEGTSPNMPDASDASDTNNPAAKSCLGCNDEERLN